MLSQLWGSFFIWFHFCRSYMTYFIYIYHIVYFCQMFLECKHPFIDIKPMVIFEAVVPVAQLSGLDSKLYPCTWQHACIYKLCLINAYWKLDLLSNWHWEYLFHFLFVGIQSWLHCIQKIIFYKYSTSSGQLYSKSFINNRPTCNYRNEK